MTHSLPECILDQAIELLDTIPGINETAAQAILAEIGIDMRRFPECGPFSLLGGIMSGTA